MAYLYGDDSNDKFVGGDEADHASGNGGNDTLNGARGDDYLDGGTGRDTLNGGAGDDYLLSGDSLADQSIDSLVGGEGDDSIQAGWGDAIDGGAGFDALTLDFTGWKAGIDLDLVAAVSGGVSVHDKRTIRGIEWVRSVTLTDGSDRLVLGANVNGDYLLASGRGGDDVMVGGATGDSLSGDEGDDWLRGGGERDVLIGGAGADRLEGEDGDDDLRNNDGSTGDDGAADTLLGGAGNDTIAVGWNDTADGGDGFDRLTIDLGGRAQAVDLDLTGFAGLQPIAFGRGTIIGMEALGFVTLGAGNDRLRFDGALDGFYPYVLGGDGDDRLRSDRGAATMFGDGGDDRLEGAEGDDRLNGGIGRDRLDGGDGDDQLDAEGYFDNDADTLSGGAGDDRIGVGAGDSADGGTGTDTLFVDYRGSLVGVQADFSGLVNGAAATVAGGSISGIEAIASATGSASGDRIVLGAGFGGVAYLYGRGGDDQLTGIGGMNIMAGDEGNDTLTGLGSVDRIDGGVGDDALAGGGEADTLIGGEGADRIDGGDGDDVIYTGTDYYAPNAGDGARDTVDGGAGDDRIEAGIGDAIDGGAGYDRVSLSFRDIFSLYGDGVSLNFAELADGGTAAVAGGSMRGVEQLALTVSRYNDAVDATGLAAAEIHGLSGDDRLTGSAGADLLFGDSGADVLDGGAGDDRLQGGIDGVPDPDIDTASYASATSGVTVSLQIAGAQDTRGAGRDTLVSIEALVGSAFNDVLTGSAGYSRLDGGAGDDLLQSGTVMNGGSGADRLVASALGSELNAGDAPGELSVDRLLGGRGDDVLIAGYGDVIDGAAGIDRLQLDYRGLGFGVSANFSALDTKGALVGGARILRVEQLESLELTDHADTVRLHHGSTSYVRGHGGDDAITGGDVVDLILGDEGNDRLFGGNGGDTVDGGIGDDRLEGEGGDDFLYGGTGSDKLTGGAGRDRLTGGEGRDTFFFADGDLGATRDAADYITDFSRTDRDRVDLSRVDADATLSGDQAFRFVGAAAFSGQPGELRFDTAGGYTYLQGDVTGDGVADFYLLLGGGVVPVAGDLAL